MHAPFVSPDLAAFSLEHHKLPPRHLGTRYDLSGEFLPEPGNTVVCHLLDGSTTQHTITKIRQQLVDMPDAPAHLAFTPVSSLHMTVFQGILEYRRKWPYWPKEMPENTSIDQMTSLFQDKLDNFPKLPAFSMRAAGLTPIGLTLKGATPDDDHVVAQWRNAFADIFGYRHPDHDTYEFHITFAYVTRWLAPESLAGWQKRLNECLEELQSVAPLIEMRAPAFCEFKDMKHFEELIVFDPA